MYIKVLLQKISLISFILAFVLSHLNAKEFQKGQYDSNLLLKKAILKLYRENQELEKRVKVLEDKLDIQKVEKDIYSEMLKDKSDVQKVEKKVEDAQALEDKSDIQKAEKDISSSDTSDTKPSEQNSWMFLLHVKDEFKKGKKIVLAQSIKSTKYYVKPSNFSQAVANVAKGQKLNIKGILEQNNEVWYKAEEGMYIDASTVSFRSGR